VSRAIYWGEFTATNRQQRTSDFAER